MPQEYRRTTVPAAPFTALTKTAEATTTNAYAATTVTYANNQEAIDILVETNDIVMQVLYNDNATWSTGDIVLKIGQHYFDFQCRGVRFQSRVAGAHGVVNLTSYTG